VRRYTAPRLSAYAALVAAGLIAGLALGRVEVVALAAPFVAALVAVAAAREPRVDVSLSLDRDRALEGEEVTATIDVSSANGATHLDVLLPLSPHLSAEGGEAFALLVDTEEPRQVSIGLHCERWGAVAVGPVLLRAQDPLGLRTWEGSGGGTRRLRVYPLEETLRALVPALDTQALAGNQVSRLRGEGIEFADLREWQRGDRIRRVNWRATALRGAFWVNEQHPERNTDVLLFLDTFAEERDQARVTHLRAVRAAATLARAYIQRKDRVGLVGFGGFVSWLLPQSGVRQLYAIVDGLLTTEIVESYVWHHVSVLPRRALPPNTLVIALTPLFDSRTATALLDLRARGYDLIVIDIASPEVEPTRNSAEPSVPERLWRLSREALRYRFAQAGVPVVTWDEGEPLAAVLEEVNTFRHLARPA
jgi:uncharacterized protein (DUF58 family)